MVGEPLARAGVAAFAFAIAVPFVGTASTSSSQPVSVADAYAAAPVQGIARAPQREAEASSLPLPVAVAGAQSEPEAAPSREPEPTPQPTSRPAPATARPLPSLDPPPTSGIVLASWYGPGFYGNRTACGQTYAPDMLGVAHRTLPCGTLVVLTYGSRTITVPVIDRGPYVAGRALDLSNATRAALGCPDLCTISLRLAQ